ncbi:MAG: UDP-N-acetylmuramoyl-L-alanine--D-glutamate ligase [Candidatus Hydrothermae bacterium]|nr:UDP-N-acetylmuramoyl-L-alanine--D-glutamate ligase [Candidatus Hydrothermae bacterium]
MTRWSGRYVGVIGAGRAGTAIAQALRRLQARVLLSEHRNPPQRMTVQDRGLHREWGGHTEALWATDALIFSPGIPPEGHALLRHLRDRIPVYGELDVVAPTWNGPVAAVTGTNGKTTTVALTAHLLRRPAAGNIGPPLGHTLFHAGPLVVELSSYQLHDVHRARFHVAALLNVAPDHLDWYPSFAAYVQDKFRIFRDQTPRDYALVSHELQASYAREITRIPGTLLWIGDLPGIRMETPTRMIVDVPSRMHLRLSSIPDPFGLRVFDMARATALLIALLIGVAPESAIRRMASFRPLPHRMERVAVHNGVVYINDSKATNPHAVAAALRTADAPVILLMGGRNKGLAFDPLLPLIQERVRHLIAFGEARQEIARIFGTLSLPVDTVSTLEEAVRVARQAARPGDWVLLSPGCASFDAFRDYKARGSAFKRLVEEEHV